VSVSAGVSTACEGLAEIGRGYGEARRALRHATPVAALEEISLFDYLAESADDTAQRLTPRGIDQLAPLAETLQAYAGCDLNVARTAEHLDVHPNTVHYRLRRVQELTGRDPRRFADLVELTTALRLHKPGSPLR
jgi:DNA-binding PucR family transcriptional regulator